MEAQSNSTRQRATANAAYRADRLSRRPSASYIPLAGYPLAIVHHSTSVTVIGMENSAHTIDVHRDLPVKGSIFDTMTAARLAQSIRLGRGILGQNSVASDWVTPNPLSLGTHFA